MNETMRVRRFAAKAAMLAIAAAAAGEAGASGCMPPPKLPLAKDVDAASFVYLGDVVGCADGKAPEHGGCGSAGYRIAPKEAFKGNPAPSIFPGNPLVHGCGLKPTVGVPVLVFADAGGQPMAASASLGGHRTNLKLTYARLEALRRVKAGDASDLADPWIFGDTRINCGLAHDVGGSQLRFSFLYADLRELQGRTMSPHFEEDGNVVMRLMPGNPAAAGGESTGGSDRGEWPEPRLTFRASLELAPEPGSGRGVVRMNDREWRLDASPAAVHSYPPRNVVQLDARPDDARAILDALLPATDVEVRFEPDSGDEPVVLRTRSTHLDPRDVRQLTACMAGQHRGHELTESAGD